MRRSERETSPDEARELLNTCEWGVLSLIGADGKPYAVPLNYVYVEAENALYFHSAKEGEKIDAIRNEAAATFVAVGENRVLPERYTAAYRSVIAEGRVSVLPDGEEIRRAVNAICDRFVGRKDHGAETHAFYARVAVLKFEIDRITGKRNRAV